MKGMFKICWPNGGLDEQICGLSDREGNMMGEVLPFIHRYLAFEATTFPFPF